VVEVWKPRAFGLQRALSEEQVQGVAEKIEAGLAEVEQAKQDEAEQRRAEARREREEAEFLARQARRQQELNARGVAPVARMEEVAHGCPVMRSLHPDVKLPLSFRYPDAPR